jgi:hypothetical protein
LPVNLTGFSISSLIPSGNFRSQKIEIRYVSIKALSGQNRKLNFSYYGAIKFKV